MTGVQTCALPIFAAETVNFFLQNSHLTTLKSKPNNEWKFNFGKYNAFAMNVVLSKDANFTNHDAVSYYGYPYNYFAPPYYTLYDLAGSNLWLSGNIDCTIAPSASWYSNRAVATITFDALAWSNSVTSQTNVPVPTIDDIKTYSTVTFRNDNIYQQAAVIHNTGAFMPLSSSVELFDYSQQNNQWNIHSNR